MDYEQCPFKAARKHLDKMTEPDRGALARGREVEEAVYAYIFRRAKSLPAAGARFPEELAALRKIHRSVLSNREMAFTRDWKPCDWFASDAWVRIKMDLLWEEALPGSKRYTRAHVVDLKTGKIYEDKLDQLDLYNLAALLLGDDLLPSAPDTAFAEMYYLDQGETRDRSLVRSGVAKAQRHWEQRVRAMFADASFLPKPGMYCRFCHLRKDAGGPCPY